MWRGAQDTDEEGQKGAKKEEEGEDVERESGRDGGEEMTVKMASSEGVQSAGEGKPPNKVTMDTGNPIHTCTYVYVQSQHLQVPSVNVFISMTMYMYMYLYITIRGLGSCGS